MIAISIPGGLRIEETQSALTSGALSIKSLAPDMVINWPYHILQRGSFLLFGVTDLSIKLPSIVIGLITAIGIFLLIKMWFRRNTATIVTAIAVTMSPFLFMAQDGTPSIMFTSLVIWLMVAGTYVTRSKLFSTFWKVLGCVLLAITLYTPLGVYITIALIITMLIHPHIRYVIRKITKLRLALALALGVLSVTPLVYAIILDYHVLLTLLGLPNGSIDIGNNIVTLGQALFGFGSTHYGAILQPLFSITATLLAIIGIYRLLTVKYTARSYAVLILGTFVLVINIINPAHFLDLYPLAILMIAVGVATLIIDWYQLFPKNPYARVAGLIPLTILVIGMVFSDLSLYTSNYRYNPTLLASYSSDLNLLETTAKSSTKTKPLQVVTSPNEQPFYALVAHYDDRFSLVNGASASGVVAVTRAAHSAKLSDSLVLDKIITNDRADQSDRFYLYKSDQK
ncbi:MAG: glycosyltransferase family 39 protein [Candidatus Saccharimonas sp.]